MQEYEIGKQPTGAVALGKAGSTYLYKVPLRLRSYKSLDEAILGYAWEIERLQGAPEDQRDKILAGDAGAFARLMQTAQYCGQTADCTTYPALLEGTSKAWANEKSKTALQPKK